MDRSSSLQDLTPRVSQQRSPSLAPAAGTVEGVSALIVNFNSVDDVLACVSSLEQQTGLHEIIVVDNDSRDGSVEAIRAMHPTVTVIPSAENLGFGGGANLAALAATGDVLLVLNPDTILEPGSVAALGHHVRTTGDVAGPIVVEGELGHIKLGEQLDWLGMPRARTRDDQPLFYVQGNAVAISAALFRSIGGFDARLFLFAEDIELCWRARLAGHDVVTVADARLVHRGGGSIGGGYLGATGRTTSDLRFGMRERNTLAVFVGCAPMWLLPVYVPAYVAKVMVTAVVVGAMGRRQLSVDLLRGLRWNVRHLPAALERRRSCPETASRTKVFVRNTVRGLNALATIRSDGMPRFVK